MKRYLAFLLAAALCLTACGAKPSEALAPAPETPASEPAPESAVPQSGSEPEQTPIDAPIAELTSRDKTLLLYRYYDSGVYEAQERLPLPESPTLADVFDAVAKAVLPGTEPPALNGCALQKSYVTYDISESWFCERTKGELTILGNSLAMTLYHNLNCDNVGYMVDGEFGLWGLETWDAAPLRLLDNPDAATFTAIREKIPYPGKEDQTYPPELGYDRYVPEAMREDKTALEITALLLAVGDLTADITSPAERDMAETILYLIWATPDLTTNDSEYEDGIYCEALLPLAASVSEKLGYQEDWFWLREHIEETARLIYGDDFVVRHRRPSLPYTYFETEGVYTPPHMGGGWNIIPIVLSYAEEGDTVTAEVVLLRDSMGGLIDAAAESYETTELIEPDNAAEYVQNEGVRRTVVMRREADGRLVFVSHHFH